jgi:hypothetical protein
LALILLTSVQPPPAATNKARIAVMAILDREKVIAVSSVLFEVDAAPFSGGQKKPPWR